MCPLRGAAVDKCDCDKLDFVAAKELNKEGLTRFVQDRTVIAALNDRLVRLIELVRTNTVSAPSDTSALHVPSAVKQWIRIHTQHRPVLTLCPLGSLFRGAKRVSGMADCGTGGEAEESSGLHLRRGGA